MKRLLTTFALLTMALAPAASFARDRDDYYHDHHTYQNQSGYRDYEGYQQPYGYDDYSQRQYSRTRDYNPGYSGYERDRYYSRDDRWERPAKYIGGGAVAGAVLGALIGHGSGAAIGAVLGGTGGYLYKKHRDRDYGYRRYGYGY